MVIVWWTKGSAIPKKWAPLKPKRTFKSVSSLRLKFSLKPLTDWYVESFAIWEHVAIDPIGPPIGRPIKIISATTLPLGVVAKFFEYKVGSYRFSLLGNFWTLAEWQMIFSTPENFSYATIFLYWIEMRSSMLWSSSSKKARNSPFALFKMVFRAAATPLFSLCWINLIWSYCFS